MGVELRRTHNRLVELRYLVEKLASTPEPGGSGSLLDNTLVVWTNELGKGNSHTLDDIPFVLLYKARTRAEPGRREGRCALQRSKHVHGALLNFEQL